MNSKEEMYAVGDWLIHLIYGVGQVKKLWNLNGTWSELFQDTKVK